MKKHLLFLLCAAAALTSCSKSESTNPTTSDVEITFIAGGINTRVASNQFESGDDISVEAYTESGSLHASEVYSYAGNSTFTADPLIAQNGESKLSYAAIYPSTATSTDFDVDFDFVIAADQSSATSYEASDLLVAKAVATASATPTLTFYHTMAIIEVKVDGAVSLDGCSVELSAQNNVLVNVTDGTYQGEGSLAAMTPMMSSEGFSLIVAPQTLAAGALATMKIGDNTYTWTLDAESTLVSGYKYSYTWTVNEATGDGEITFTGLISDWATGEWGSASTDDTTTPDPDDSTTTTPDQGGSTESEDFVLSAETMGYSGTSNASGSVTLGGVAWSYYGVSATDSYNTTYIELDDPAAGYITNTTPLSGEAATMTIVGNGYVNTNLLVTIGSSANPTTTLASSSADGSGWGSEYVYSIPAGTTYIKFACSVDTTYDAAITSITFEY